MRRDELLAVNGASAAVCGFARAQFRPDRIPPRAGDYKAGARPAASVGTAAPVSFGQ